MSMTPEKKVKNKVVEVLKSEGVYYFFANTHGYGRSGVPDIICCHHGKFIAIECKAGKGKLTPLQALEIEAIRRHDGIALVVNEDNLDKLRDYLRQVREERV